MASLMDRMLKTSTINTTEVLSSSRLFQKKDEITTSIPILNIAFSGNPDGGYTPGLTMWAGPSKHFKTMFSLLMAKAYLDKYEDAVLLFYDSEFGTPQSYFESMGIATDRVIHTPIIDVEELKFDTVKQLEEIKLGDHAIIVVDSIGNLASKKEVENAMEGKSSADFSRAKQLKGYFRMITPHLSLKDIPMVVVNHTYKEIATMYPKDIVGGGTGSYYSSSNIYILGRQQSKDSDGDLDGYNFIINVEKSRAVREKSKLAVSVTFDNGISKTSGLQELATDIGAMASPSKGWYSFVDLESGEMEDKKYRAKDLLEFKVWEPVLNNPTFKAAVAKRYQVSYNSMIQSEESEDE